VLSFVAGAAADVFPSDLAEAIAAVVRERFPDAGAASEVYRSDPVDAIGWSRLQTRVAKTLPAAPQLSGMDAYQSVYLPVAGGVERVAIPNVADPLEIGSLDALLGELRAFAAQASLPTDDVELMQLAAHYLENDALIDEDLDVQTYVQLMLAAKQSAAHGVPLWIAVE